MTTAAPTPARGTGTSSAPSTQHPALSPYLPRSDKADRRVYPRPWDSRYAPATLVRRTLVKAAAQHFPRNSTLLDFGCGNMPYRPLLSPYLKTYEGIDLPGNPQATHHLRPDGTTTVPTNHADILLSTQVLEHVISPEAYLAESYRMLRPGGLLTLTTHGLWLHHPDPVDYHRWTGPGLKRLIETAGFTTQNFTGIMGLLPSGLQLASDALIRRLLPKPLRPYLGPPFALLTQPLLLALDHLHTPTHRSFDAAAFLIIAQKPAV